MGPKRKSSWEIYSDIKVRPPFFVRADGRGFSVILQDQVKPFDEGFAKSLVNASKTLFEASGPSPKLAYIFSDEVNVLFTDTPFNGRLEKLDSLLPSQLSAALSLELGRIVSMDARTVPLCPGEISEYLAQGQDEAWRNHVFSHGFYTLVKDGLTHKEAMDKLRGMKQSQIHEIMYKRGINLAHLPAWERRGIMIYRREGAVVEDWNLPLFRSKVGIAQLSDILEQK